MFLDDRGPTGEERYDESAWVTFAIRTGIETTADVYGESFTVTRGYMRGIPVTLVYAGERLIGHTRCTISKIELVADAAYKGMFQPTLQVLYVSSEAFKEMTGYTRSLK